MPYSKQLVFSLCAVCTCLLGLSMISARSSAAVVPAQFDTALDVLVAAGEVLEQSLEGIETVTEFVQPAGMAIGGEFPQVQEKNSNTGAMETKDPRDTQRIKAEGQSDKSGAELADLLVAAADGAQLAGIALELGFARATGLGMTGVGLLTMTGSGRGRHAFGDYSEGARDDTLVSRCLAGEFSSDQRSSRPGDDNFSPGLKMEAYFSPIAMMTEAACLLEIAAYMALSDYERSAEDDARRRLMILAAADAILYHGPEYLNGELVHKLTLSDLGADARIQEDGHMLELQSITKLYSDESKLIRKTRTEGVLIRNFEPQGSLMQQESLDFRERLIPVAESGTDFEIRPATYVISSDDLTDSAPRFQRVARGSNEPQAVFFEQEYSDYRKLPGTQYYHPFRTTSRVGGMMSDEELAQMREAAQQLDELDKQMAAMPAKDRRMMQQMMGSKIDDLRSMVNSGTFEFTLVTNRVYVNGDLKQILAGNVPLDSAFLLQDIQYKLDSLDYDPGNKNGELSKATIAAIIKFQRDYQLELTGQPSEALANILSATVTATR